MSDCDIFLSYAHQDRDRVQTLISALVAEGWRVFWDRTIPPGESFRNHIEARLDIAPVVLVCWSRHSILSDWVGQEAEAANKRMALIPVMIDTVRAPLGLAHIHGADLVGWIDGKGGPLPAVLKTAIVHKLSTSAVAAPSLSTQVATPPPEVRPVILQTSSPGVRARIAKRWPIMAGVGIAIATVGLFAWMFIPWGGAAVNQYRFVSGTYELTALNKEDSGRAATVEIKLYDRDKLHVNGVLPQIWAADGKFNPQIGRGYYDWKFNDGKTGRTTFEVQDDGTLTGTVSGSGINWSFRAQRKL